MRPGAVRVTTIGLLLGLTALVAAAATIDPQASQIGFSIKTRWGQELTGRFPRYEGEIETVAGGRHRVHLRLSSLDVEIVGNPTYTKFTRGDGFFDAERYPVVEFHSDAYPTELLHKGGRLGGDLILRGIRRHEVFVIEPATCARPALDCDVVASGSVARSDYRINRWGFALSSRVIFNLRVRLVPGSGQ